MKRLERQSPFRCHTTAERRVILPQNWKSEKGSATYFSIVRRTTDENGDGKFCIGETGAIPDGFGKNAVTSYLIKLSNRS